MSPVDTQTELTPASVIDGSPILKAIVQQIRANDSFGTYRNWADELLLKPYIVSKAAKRDIPIDESHRPPDPKPNHGLLPGHCLLHRAGNRCPVSGGCRPQPTRASAGRWSSPDASSSSPKPCATPNASASPPWRRWPPKATSWSVRGIDLAKQFPEVQDL